MTTQELLTSLASTVCPCCSRVKKPRQSFCTRCYFTLAPAARDALYRKVGPGYEAAFTAAMALLKSGQVGVPPTTKAAGSPQPVHQAQGELFSSGVSPKAFRG